MTLRRAYYAGTLYEALVWRLKLEPQTLGRAGKYSQSFFYSPLT